MMKKKTVLSFYKRLESSVKHHLKPKYKASLVFGCLNLFSKILVEIIIL